MDTNDVVVPYVHVHLDGLDAPSLLREVEGEEHHEEVLIVDIHLREVAPCEAVFYGQLVEAEDISQQPPVGSVLSALGAVDVAPDESLRVGEMVRQLLQTDV